MDERTRELKEMIEAKSTELTKEIAHALSNNDNSSYEYLKSLQLQCQAEIRVINHLASDADNKSFIIC